MKSGIYASLDIGTTSIKVIVAEVLNGQINVIGVGNERSSGLSRGLIVDIEQTAASIQAAAEQAADKADIEINELIVGVPATNLKINSCHGSYSINPNHQEITEEEVRQVVRKALEGNISQEGEVVNITANEFIVDGFDGIKDPRGMIGNRLEFRGTVASIPRSIVHNIKKAVERAGFYIRNIILTPDAMAQMALNEDERNFGSILIDMGGGQTSVAVVHENQLKLADVIQEGGEYVTKDISIVLNTSVKNAEKLKRDVGYAYSPDSNSDRTVAVDVVGQNDFVNYKESYISEVIEARLEQIFEQIKYVLDNAGATQMPAGIVISGGAASIPGIEDLAEMVFNVPVRVYIPDFMSVRYPAFTNALGLIKKDTYLSEIEFLINHTIVNPEEQQVQKPRNVAQKPNPAQQQAVNNKQTDVETSPKEDKKPMSEQIREFFSGFFE
jgi:cell division protein FtsA